MIWNELPNDRYRPTIAKPAHENYDNYRIYDIICVDSTKETHQDGIVLKGKTRKQLQFLAIQAFSVELIGSPVVMVISKAY